MKKIFFCLIFLVFSSQVSRSQKIQNLDFELIGSNIILNFNVTSKFTNFGNDERYSADVYYKELIKGYDEVSTESFFRRKIELPTSITNSIKPGNNSISIDVYNYLSEYLGSETLFEFQIELNPSFIPVYFESGPKLKIGKQNTINLNYWDGYSNLKYMISQNGVTVRDGSLNKDGIIDLPKSQNKGNFLLTVTNNGYGNSSYSKNVNLKKGSKLPLIAAVVIGGGIIYFVTSGGGSNGGNKNNPPLPSPPLPGG